MEVISMIVNDQFGVMQRVMGEFTRKKINVETIVVGKCELPGKARIVLSVKDRKQAEQAVERLTRLQDVIEIEIIDESRHEAYALVANSFGKARLIGSIEEVDNLVEMTKPNKFIKTINAL
ncbi:MAG: ACT domain-containing protein [Methanomassiliicoccales archaeon]|jgi:acetolactate synthase-1/3 small subunit|nr:ACT domain-containing protein [Methanomassiliicoccales archaeon]